LILDLIIVLINSFAISRLSYQIVRWCCMKFIVLSHAGLWIEHEGQSILIDPWLIGSCYWRSWWNFPELPREFFESLCPSYIYLTHLHWDHFQGPSLRLFHRKTPILVPLVHTHRMVDDLNDLGFTNVVEIPHGDVFKLGKNFTLQSFQFGLTVDSAVVVKSENKTILNANDCKLFGLPLKQITSQYPVIDFVLRSYSSANPIPYCINDYKTKYPLVRTHQDYIEDFTNFSLGVGASYAIPFASNHCFLHRETIQYNETGVLPTECEDFLDQKAKQLGLKTRCVVMPPGSEWSEDSGFNISEFDYSKRDTYISKMLVVHRQTLEKQYELEDKTVGNFKKFKFYFDNLLVSVPTWLPGIRSLRVIFEVVGAKDSSKLWMVDFAQSFVTEISSLTDLKDYILISVCARVINDCTSKRMFSVWSASKRLKVDLIGNATLTQLGILLGILDAYEVEYLPLVNHLKLRYLMIWLRRWREFVQFASLIVQYRFLNRKSLKSMYQVNPQRIVNVR
jgi:UDP-MurNAc hydroxylase